MRFWLFPMLRVIARHKLFVKRFGERRSFTLISGSQTACANSSSEKTSCLPIATGLGEINFQLGWIALYGSDRRRYRQRSARLMLVANIVDCNAINIHRLQRNVAHQSMRPNFSTTKAIAMNLPRWRYEDVAVACIKVMHCAVCDRGVFMKWSFTVIAR